MAFMLCCDVLCCNRPPFPHHSSPLLPHPSSAGRTERPQAPREATGHRRHATGKDVIALHFFSPHFLLTPHFFSPHLLTTPSHFFHHIGEDTLHQNL